MKTKIKTLILLHILLAVYSTSGIFSKLAGTADFLSIKFILYYGCVILLLGIYAIGWQQIIRHMDLTSAYANKAVCTIWGSVWGILFFHESITLSKAFGLVMIVAGIVIFATDREDTQDE